MTAPVMKLPDRAIDAYIRAAIDAENRVLARNISLNSPVPIVAPQRGMPTGDQLVIVRSVVREGLTAFLRAWL